MDVNAPTATQARVADFAVFSLFTSLFIHDKSCDFSPLTQYAGTLPWLLPVSKAKDSMRRGKTWLRALCQTWSALPWVQA